VTGPIHFNRIAVEPERLGWPEVQEPKEPGRAAPLEVWDEVCTAENLTVAVEVARDRRKERKARA
jgi:hypothetical protein